MNRSRKDLRAYLVGLTFFGVGLIVIPVCYFVGLISIETVNMLGRYMAFAIVAVGLDLLWGYTGILSLCQAFFFALGGYAMGMYLAHHGPLDGDGIPRALYVVTSQVSGFALPWFWKPFKFFPAAIFLGFLVSGLVALIIGYVGFLSRVRGVYFAILTQAITVAAWLIFCKNDMRLCGTNGLTNFVTILGFRLTQPNVKLGLYVVTLLMLALPYFICRYVAGSRLGRILIAVRDNENQLRFSGYQPHLFKTLVFVVSALIASLGGMLYAPQMGIFTPEYMTAKWSILVVIWVAVGGRGTLSGAILGALAVNLTYNFITSRAPDAWLFIQGGLFIGVVLLFPDGLMGLWRRASTKFRGRIGVMETEDART